MKITIKRSILAALLATPALYTHAEEMDISNSCYSVRNELATSYLDDISYPSNIRNSIRQERVQSFSRAWKKLTKQGICQEKINPKAVVDLVKVCGRADLDLGDCTTMVDTLIWLMSQEEEEGLGGLGGGGEGLVCAQEVKDCGNDVSVGRDSTNGCAFYPCPPSKEDETEGEGAGGFCHEDLLLCKDGTSVGRDIENNCNFFPCPETEGEGAGAIPAPGGDEDVFCAQDMFMCEDGTFVGRDNENNCNFFPCRGPTTDGGSILLPCKEDLKICPDGSALERVFANGCTFPPCPPKGGAIPVPEGDQGFTVCAKDVYKCTDGTYKSRDPNNNCEFYPCRTKGEVVGAMPLPTKGSDPPTKEGLACAADVKMCSDGIYVSRDSSNGCLFRPCPVAFISSKGLTCPCAGSINSITAGDRLSDNSCQDRNRPVIQKFMGKNELYPTGSSASFDENGGECADGDAIHMLTRDEGEACVEHIIDACARLGREIGNP
uniref:Uncharacterized protein n=1 Tax=Ditylum brightwellii TaxID=49249 RepID=A0A7S1YTB0_9STRA